MTKEQFIKDYSFQPGDYKWLVGGGNILKYVGTEVIFATYETLENDEIKENYQEAHIHEISGYEPVTMTYLIKYTVGKELISKFFNIIQLGYAVIDINICIQAVKCNNKKKRQILKIKYDQFSKKEILFKLAIK